MTEYAFEAGKRASTAISWSVATVNYSNDFTTPFSNGLTAPYIATVIAAFARWASVSALTFTQVADAATVPIRIGFGIFANYSELGETDYRAPNGVLSNDTLIRLLDPAVLPTTTDANGALVYSQYNVTLFQVVLHEIGHALGLDHTTDPATVMYPYATTTNTDLAAGDIWGINTLYPLFTVTALNDVQSVTGPGQVNTFSYVITRYSDPSVSLTLNYAVTGAVSPSISGGAAATASAFVGGALPSGQITFAPGSTTATLSIQTVSSALPQPNESFSFSLTTGNASDIVTVRGSNTGTILDDDDYGQVPAGTLAVYRFFDTHDGSHFYSTDGTERNTLIATRPDLIYEGVGLTAVADPSSDPAAAPVFRFFDSGNGTHLYSASTTERDTILATRPDLVPEGIAFYEHIQAQPLDQPVYRFFDLTDGSHFYTASAAERATVDSTRPNLVDEGVAFYAPGA